MSVTVLALYDGQSRQVTELAGAVEQGVQRVDGATASAHDLGEASREDLVAADAIALGSPNWSGISGRMKGWLDEKGDLWEEGVLNGKPGAAFTSSKGRTSGMEFTLASLIHWMLACGMVVVGLPWSELTRVSGSYYGPTASGGVSPEDLEQARNLGQRLAETAIRLSSTPWIRAYRPIAVHRRYGDTSQG